METAVNVENVSFEYEAEDGSRQVLKDFSVSFGAGEFTAVLGHNGSGKSTLAKLLNGLNRPNSGKVTVFGMDAADDRYEIEVKRTVGMVFQNPDNQLVATVVDEEVAFGLENLGIPHDEMVKRVEEALKDVGMYELRKAAPHKLSGGQKQRVAIAGIIAMEPQCIVFDEPTAMLDPNGRKEVMEVILRLCREKHITVILITHYMNEAALADRTIVMDSGRIVADGTPREVFSDVGLLKKVGLDVPQSTLLASMLAEKGYGIEKNILFPDECAEGIASAVLGKGV